MSTLSVRVDEIRNEAEDIKSFRLVSASGDPLPSFTAGSHIDVHVEPGLTRQYSLANAPEDGGAYLIAVKKEPLSRGGSRAMHERVRQGDVLQIGAPRNNFALASAGRHLFFGGGIGITPLLGMAMHLDSGGVPWELHYFSRSPRHTAFHELLSAPRYAEKVHFHYALEQDAVRGYLRKQLWHRPDGAHLYLCGPRPFMDTVEQTASATWPPEAVHVEYFSADPASLAAPRPTFRVRLARRQIECTIPEDESICTALFDHGVRIESMCGQGVCGTCVTGVLEGIPDHRDVYLSAEQKAANDRIMPCVSRARSEMLVLDL
ncbi:PDR/VanB family oxidoreductase [Ramlibacter sp.]|uniref:PDR/VanB family oxidoreductase n=1 Tax=Ramlibacter sp. TaxID=1917967 RepID=UPI003D11A422